MRTFLGSEQGGTSDRVVGDTTCNKSFEPVETLLGRLQQQLRVFDIFESKTARAPPGLVIAAEISLRTTTSERFPVQLKLFVQLVGNARGTASSAILRDAHLGRMFDRSARTP